MTTIKESEIHANVTGSTVVGTGDDTSGMTWSKKKKKRKSFREFIDTSILRRKEIENVGTRFRNK